MYREVEVAVREEVKRVEKKYSVEDLLAIMARLREPDGCPWDRVQTHDSIKKDLIEESYEAIDALENGTDKDFANELGDVLMQVVFHSQMAKERGAFDFYDVVNELSTKLVTRHTHVFGNDKADSAAQALTNWEKNKKKEKGLESATAVLKDVPKYYPALMRAEKVQKKAAGVGFDWTNIEDVYAKVYEEIDEVKDAQKEENRAHIEEEYGDLLFAVVNLGRFLKVSPETALASGCNKFISRFEQMEQKITDAGKELSELSLAEMDAYWDKAKADEK